MKGKRNLEGKTRAERENGGEEDRWRARSANDKTRGQNKEREKKNNELRSRDSRGKKNQRPEILEKYYSGDSI